MMSNFEIGGPPRHMYYFNLTWPYYSTMEKEQTFKDTWDVLDILHGFSLHMINLDYSMYIP